MATPEQEPDGPEMIPFVRFHFSEGVIMAVPDNTSIHVHHQDEEEMDFILVHSTIKESPLGWHIWRYMIPNFEETVEYMVASGFDMPIAYPKAPEEHKQAYDRFLEGLSVAPEYEDDDAYIKEETSETAPFEPQDLMPRQEHLVEFWHYLLEHNVEIELDEG